MDRTDMIWSVEFLMKATYMSVILLGKYICIFRSSFYI